MQIQQKKASRRDDDEETPQRRRRREASEVIQQLAVPEQPRAQTAVAMNRAAQMGSIVFGVRF